MELTETSSSSSSPSSPLPTSTDTSSVTTTTSTVSVSENIFSGETFTTNGNGEEVAVEPLENPDGKDENCKHCQKKLILPRVLSCLHFFCDPCIAKLTLDDSSEEAVIECPTCDQITKVPRGPSSLPFHFILTNILDLATTDISTLLCTSCKSKEEAISRCNGCANFLCADCDKAHRTMRCFEEHQVVTLEASGTIHKPLYCSVHATENLKYFCYSCETPVCNECLISDHKATEHRYEIISEAEKDMRMDVEKLLKNTRGKIDHCDVENSKLYTSLQELQQQHDTARNEISQAYDAIISAIEKRKEQVLMDLGGLHTEREIKIMEQLHQIEKAVEQMEYCAMFTRKLLDNGNGHEILSMKKMISQQLTKLIDTIPKVDINYSLEFIPNTKKFEEMVPELFGKFQTESTVIPKESTPPPTIPSMPSLHETTIKNSTIISNGSSSGNGSSITTGSVSVTASSPISLPTSLQSSFDGDISNNISSFGKGFSSLMPATLLPAESPTPAIVPPAATPLNVVPPVSSMVEYNLHRLAASMVENTTTDINETIIPTPSVGSNFLLEEMLNGDQQMLNNLQALAKIGDMSNGNAMNNLNNLGMMDSFMTSPSPILQTPSALAAINDDMKLNCFSQFRAHDGNQNSSAGSNVTNGIGRAKALSMQIRVKFGALGQSRGQFNSPHGFCLGLDEEIIVADTNNHRIEIFDKSGTYKFHFGVPGKEEGQLWFPRKVAVMRPNSKFVVCDRGNERSRMQIFTKNGHYIKKIAIRYIDIVAGLAVTQQGHIVAVDSVSPTVFIISEDGDLVHWFDCSDHMREPSDIAINGNDFYVCDFKGHCVAVFSETGQFKTRIGSEKVTCFPNGIDISDAGDILIGDSHGNRFHVACYNRYGVLQCEYECPYVKVSRCCGLKITSEGYIVTLAKNNHHVLVLNTLYIQ